MEEEFSKRCVSVQKCLKTCMYAWDHTTLFSLLLQAGNKYCILCVYYVCCQEMKKMPRMVFVVGMAWTRIMWITQNISQHHG